MALQQIILTESCHMRVRRISFLLPFAKFLRSASLGLLTKPCVFSMYTWTPCQVKQLILLTMMQPNRRSFYSLMLMAASTKSPSALTITLAKKSSSSTYPALAHNMFRLARLSINPLSISTGKVHLVICMFIALLTFRKRYELNSTSLSFGGGDRGTHLAASSI